MYVLDYIVVDQRGGPGILGGGGHTLVDMEMECFFNMLYQQ